MSRIYFDNTDLTLAHTHCISLLQQVLEWKNQLQNRQVLYNFSEKKMKKQYLETTGLCLSSRSDWGYGLGSGGILIKFPHWFLVTVFKQAGII